MSTANSLEWLMLDLINEERTSRGLDPLQLELRLNDSSEDHSSWMLQQDVFSHTGTGGSNAGSRMAGAGFDFSGAWGWGENIAWQSMRGAPGYADDVENLHQSLMNSPGHRANILNPDYEVIGIGIETGDFDGWSAVMATQNFAYTGGATALDSRGGSAAPDPGPVMPAPDPDPAPQPDPDPVPAPEAGTAPVLGMETVAMQAGQWVRLAETLSYRDADGDAPQVFRIRDKGGDFEFALNGEVLDPAKDKYWISPEDIGDVMIRTDQAGIRKQLVIRARDEDGWSAREMFNAASVPDRDKPLLAVENMVFSAAGGALQSLAENLTLLDRSGDAAEFYELLDTSGRDNFVFAGAGAADADAPLRVAAADLGDVLLRGDTAPGTSYVKARAYDGELYSAWETFRLDTVAADDPLVMA